MTLGVYWDRQLVGHLQRVAENTREYQFSYSETPRQISLPLPPSEKTFTAAESRPFFEALLPEGGVREQIARQLKLATSDSFGLLAELGRDCAGALQVIEGERLSDSPSVHWLESDELDLMIDELPTHPLGISAGDQSLRLSLAGVQQKAVLVRDGAGRFGRPLDGMPSTHILKPEPVDGDYPGLAANEYFCMRLAARCGLSAAPVELDRIADRPCLIVERFDRNRSVWPPRRVHQEDLCQALGLTPDYKHQHEGWKLPSYAGLAELLSRHSAEPGLDRLAGAKDCAFHYLVGNADAHAKNISILHTENGVRLSPLYDVVSTAAYPQLSRHLSLGIGDEFDPDAITSISWSDLADDYSLNARGLARVLRDLTRQVMAEARVLRDEASSAGWHHPCIESILATIDARSSRVA